MICHWVNSCVVIEEKVSFIHSYILSFSTSFFSYTLCPAHGTGRVLKHSISVSWRQWVSGGSRCHTLPRYQSEQMKILNTLFPSVIIELTTCPVYSHEFVALRHGWPQALYFNLDLNNKSAKAIIDNLVFFCFNVLYYVFVTREQMFSRTFKQKKKILKL